MKKQLLMGTLTAAMMAGAVAPTFAADGLSASAAVASSYLWRGIDLGSGTPAVSGDIHYTVAGAYGGVWASSGDTSFGTEYDLYVGYGLDLSGFTIDLSVWNYNYSGLAAGPTVTDETFKESSEAILALGFAGATFKYYDNIASDGNLDGSAGYEYYSLGYGAAGFTGLVGYADPDGDDNNYTHIDLSYAYNENLSFTVSKVVDVETDDMMNDDPIVVVAYNLPIK